MNTALPRARKLIVAFFISVIISGVLVFAPSAKAETTAIDTIEVQIQQLLQLIQALQAQIAALTAAGGGSAISVGATVETTDTLKVRSAADTSANVIGMQTPNTRGTVLEGPANADGYTWWRVAYTTVTGWSAANWLKVISQAPATNPTPSPVPTPTPTPTPTPIPTPTPLPGATAFFQDFSGPLDTTKFTEAHGRMELDTPVQPSTVAVSGGRLHIKAGQQNYGDSAVRINQPFDFSGRTGTITFDVNTNQGDGWTEVALTELPYPYVSFDGDNTRGPFPQEGFLIQYRSAFSCVSLKVYRNGVQTADGYECGDYGVKNGPDILNRVVMQVSASQITVTTDGHKVTFPVSLGFTRGYLYLISHNHATMKYAGKPTWDTQWDNVSFDGPVIAPTRVALAPFNLPAGVTNPRLVLMARHDLHNTNVALSYRLNGGPAHSIPLVRRAGSVANFMISQPVDVSELKQGTNIVTFEQTGMTRPEFTNVQLVWNGPAGTTSPLPTPTPTPIPTPAPTPPSSGTNSIFQSISNGAALNGSNVVWIATPTGAPTKVEFFIDGTLSWTELTALHQYNGDPNGRLDTTKLSNGTHQLMVRATYSDGSQASNTASVTVANSSSPAPTSNAPTLNFNASPTSITSGQSSTLAWGTTNATLCTASNGWSGSKAVSGNLSVSPTMNTTYSLLCSGAGGSISKDVSVAVSAATQTPPPQTTNPPVNTTSGLAFSEDFSTATAFSQRFDHGWSGEWNAGSMFGDNANDWHGDHDMSCSNPNSTHRTIHLSSAQQANDAAFYHCIPEGNPAKGHLMTSVNTAGYITVWFAPKQVFNNVSKVCWDQNLTDLGGGKWTVVNFLTPSEYAGETDLGYTSADFPNNGGPSSPQGEAQNGVKVFRGGMNAYTNGKFHGGASVSTVTDKAARYQHCVIDNGNGTLTTTIARPSGGIDSETVTGNIPDGDIKVEFADDSYNPDKHFNIEGVPRNSSGLYTWHWDNIQIYTNQ